VPFHNLRHATHMSFTAVFGMNVFQHCLSGQRARVSNASVKFANALGVRTCTTDESQATVISTDAVHNDRRVTAFSAFNVITITLWLMVLSR
jgi:hypothetical protein